MERAVMLSGVGGQGIQMAATVLARTAMNEGLRVAMLGVYGGEMRGGPSEATLIFGDGPIVTPPVLSSTWSVISLHPTPWDALVGKLEPDGLALVNSSLCEPIGTPTDVQVVELAATDLALELGDENLAAMIMTGAYACVVDLAGVDVVVDAMREAIPPYRSARIEANAHAIELGYASVETLRALRDGAKP
jgi:2-oxoglutarate ferredoxin oxidoreductase subunit gamma